MKCSRPRYAWDSRALNPSGLRSLVFNPSFGIPGSGRDVACGKCTGCAMNQSRDKAVRLYHEILISGERTCVATLTFDDANCPDNIGEIRVIAKAFKKRLVRRDINPRSHWLCEYGGKFDRPHAHVVFFNSDFRDCGIYQLAGSSYEGSLLTDLWGMGHCQIDVVSPEACRYVAGHNQQKILAPKRSDGSPTFLNIPAKRPAIGMTFAREFASDILSVNSCVVGGSQTAVPKAYTRYEPDLFASVIEHQRQYALERLPIDPDVTIAASDRAEELARMRLIQAAEIRAWHRGCHSR